MAIEHLLRPRSIAIVGASEKIGPGLNSWNALKAVGFEGKIHLVNPNKPELLGQKTYASLSQIDGQVDAVFAAVSAEQSHEVLTQAIAKGAGAMAILASGFGDAGPGGLQRQQQLAELAVANNVALCGPNCLGLLNFAHRTALFGTSLPDALPRGSIAAVVQSGSIGIALLNAGRGLNLSHLITSGNEAVTASADYIEALLDDEAVKTIVVFAEQIRKPAKFIAMARRATERGIPMVVLKSGRSEKGQAAVMAHTGAVAGSVEACDAALRAAGVIQVFTIDELIETAALVSGIKRMPAAAGIAALSLSGGEIALALDAAEESGVAFAAMKEAEERITGLLPAFAHISNPLDLTWAGLYDMNVAEGCANALASQAEVGAVVLLQDAPTRLGQQQAARYSTLLQAVSRGAEAAGKPLIALTNLSDEPHPLLRETAQACGVPYLRGTREGLGAIAKFGQWAAGRAVQEQVAPTSTQVVDSTRALLRTYSPTRLPAEHEARQILAGYGVRGPEERLVATAREAGQAAQAIGFPVVVKGIVVNMLHKSDAGLVKLRLNSVEAVEQAAEQMLATMAGLEAGEVRGLLVQKMESALAEIFIGARVDPDFGPLIVVGGGGITVELYRDVAVRSAPVTSTQAREMVESTKMGKLLDGFRGSARADKDAVVEAVAAISRFIADFANEVQEVEINPFAVFSVGKGGMALDGVIVPKADRE
jgi:acetate---CoA ligase (ADP-forming)